MTTKQKTRKKWTNEKIDAAIFQRPIIRLTDCKLIKQPSTTPIQWKCKICNNQWFATVDNVIHKQSGCPACARNVAYTVESLNQRLINDGRTDLFVKSIFSVENSRQRFGLFVCNKCEFLWQANIHNVIKYRYGCPKCNNNIGSRIEVNGLRFDSKLEFYFWKRYQDSQCQYKIIRQQRYCQTRKLTCDFYFPEMKLWVEISGNAQLIKEKYWQTINEKRNLVQQKKEHFVVLTSFAEIDKFISTIGEFNENQFE